jgi:F-type H+-transporting ATPase subunit epsilon
MEDDERAARAALSRLEADMVRRFASLSRPHP